ERGERNQENVERIDEEQAVGRDDRAVGDHARGEQRSGDERGDGEAHVHVRRGGPRAIQAERERTEQRQREHGADLDHFSVSLRCSMCRRSRLSKASRTWKKKMPRISTPTSTSSAIPISTASGIP